MSLIFTVTAVAGLLYFIVRARRFDLFALAYFSAFIYFLPGFFGYTLTPPTVNSSIRETSPLELETYFVMITVLISICLGGIIQDSTLYYYASRIKLKGCEYVPYVSIGLAIIGFLASFKTVGTTILFQPDKSLVIESLNRWRVLWVMGASLSATISYLQKKWIAFSAGIILLLVDFYIGFRSPLAITLMTIFLLWAFNQGKQRLVLNIKAILSGFLIALTAFTYKFIYTAVKRGDWELVFDRLTNPGFYLRTISESEPFTTQEILNKVIEDNFRVGLSHLKNLLSHFTLFSNNLGIEVITFNDLFQPTLFPEAVAGMANNIWAEMWSSGGWLLLFCFIQIFLIVLFLGTHYLKSKDPVVKGGVALAMVYWGFYIHRNDLLYQITLEKRVLAVWLLCVISSMLASSFASAIKSIQAH